MRKAMKILGLVVVLMLIPLTAMAQEDGGGSEAVINVAGTVLFLSLIIQYVIEWVRTRWSTLDGDLIRLISIVLGIAAAVGFDLDTAADVGFADMPKALSYVLTGLVIAGAAGFLGTGKNALRAKDPLSSVPPSE